MEKQDIIQELKDLGSSLASLPTGGTFLVPEGYFETLPSVIMARINRMNIGDDENAGSGLLNFSKELPYHVPSGYFDGLEERIMNRVRESADYQTSREELESISPLLGSLNKTPVYSVPKDYFEKLSIPFDGKQETKIISITNRKWFKLAVAAILVGVIATAAFIFIGNKNGEGRAIAKFEKDVKKIKDVEQTQTLLEVMHSGLNERDVAKAGRPDDVQQLLEDISVDELNDFTEQSRDIENVMMTN